METEAFRQTRTRLTNLREITSWLSNSWLVKLDFIPLLILLRFRIYRFTHRFDRSIASPFKKFGNFPLPCRVSKISRVVNRIKGDRESGKIEDEKKEGRKKERKRKQKQTSVSCREWFDYRDREGGKVIGVWLYQSLKFIDNCITYNYEAAWMEKKKIRPTRSSG